MKVLVTGASGLLGREVVKVIKERGWKVISVAYSRATPDNVQLDLRDLAAASLLLKNEAPDYVVHCAAERAPDRVEKQPEEARLLNVEVSRNLAMAQKQNGLGFLYISTDYVFDGTAPPYETHHPSNPLNKYGESKLEGERVVLEAHPEAMVLRIPVLYGPVETLGESAVTCLYTTVLNPAPSAVSHYERRYPALTTDVAEVIAQLLQEKEKNCEAASGIFHYGGDQMMTKYDMVLAIAGAMGEDHAHITPLTDPTPGAPRPYDARLSNARLEEMGIKQHTPFAEAIRGCLLPHAK